MNTSIQKIQLGEITIDVTHKDVKNIHLSVYPPVGKVRITAPMHMELDTIRIYAISKLGWIKKQQEKIRNQEREAPREFLNRESHYFNGKRYLLRIEYVDTTPKVELQHETMVLHVRPGATIEKMQSVLDEWYRHHLKEKIVDLIDHWEKIIPVKVNEFGVKKMKTKWGTCNTEAKRIWLNLELAKKPPECLEYIIVHEMIHLLERRHNQRFIRLMNEYMPKWRFYRDELNRLPVRHEDWKY